MNQLKHLIIFTDLDGCLLNKHDYQWQDAEECLLRLVDLQVPVVLASSKTVAEMQKIATEVPFVPAPFIAENGGAICWGPLDTEGDAEILCTGIPRPEILDVLTGLKSRFRFRSFQDLGFEGVMKSTDLEATNAALAMQRQSTEPLLWDDSAEKRLEFEQILKRHKLTLTRGGRFWHVAGHTSKGLALQQVLGRYNDDEAISVVIGDSQIDQSMLNVAHIPIGIRVGEILSVSIQCPPGIVPPSECARGWAEAVNEVLDRFV